MRTPGDIGRRSTEIDDLVTNGEFERAFIRLIDLAGEFARSDDQAHEAIILSGTFNVTAKSRRRDLISGITLSRAGKNHSSLAGLGRLAVQGPATIAKSERLPSGVFVTIVTRCYVPPFDIKRFLRTLRL